MLITYGSTVLVPGSAQGAIDVRVNGQQIVDEAQFFRAAVTTYYARQNKSTHLEFETWWNFNTRGLTEQFMLSHWAGLAPTDTLYISCGEGEGTQYNFQLPGAVLESASPAEWRGNSVRFHYVFLGGIFTTDSISPPNEDALIKRGKVSLSAGDTSKTVTFASSFGGTPTVIVRVNRPSASADTVIDWDAPEADQNSAGFIARGAAIPSTGYVLNWEAIAP